MTPERWARLKEIYEAVLERSATERLAFVQKFCGSDAELKAELERLLRHSDQIASFLESSHEPRSYPDGLLMGGRFRIVSFLGRGGMGEVYSAEDTSLGGRVALKIVRPEIALDPHNVDCLLREVHLARIVTHRNVCRVFDLERHEGPAGEVLFVTMEEVTGETLAERLARGPMSPRDALLLAKQIAAGVGAAHAAGVVHRDLKPANVMLAEEGRRAVVMDFGLAKRVDPDGRDQSGPLYGTAAYLAPELLDRGDPSPASDLYSFGILLHEMAAGVKPSSPENLDPALPERWRTTIRKCLARDPSLRFASMEEAFESIEAPIKPEKPWHISKALVLSGTALVALFLIFFRLYERSPVFPEGATMLLAEIDNTTANKALDASTELFRSQLQQSARFQLRTEALRGRAAREMAARENIPYILFTSISPLGDGISLNLDLEQLAGASIFKRRGWTYSKQMPERAQLFDAVHDACLWVRRTVGETASDLAAHDRMPQDTTTQSWEALALFSSAEKFQARRETSTAISVLEQAVQIDPNFALAYMRLGDLLISTYRREEGLRYWQKAFDETNRQHLTRREELRIKGLYASDTENFPMAEAAFAQMEIEYPEDFLPSFYLANILRWQGRLDESLQKLRVADRKQPNSLAVMAGMATNALLRTDAAALRVQTGRMRPKYPAYASHYEGLLAFAEARYDDALGLFFEESKAEENERSILGSYFHVVALTELGRFSEAMEELKVLIGRTQEPELRGSELLARAYMEWKMGNSAAVRSSCYDSVSRNPGPLLLSRAGVLLARSGNPKDAMVLEQRLANFIETPQSSSARLRLAGEILMAKGDLKGAIDTFEKLDAIDPRLRYRESLARAYLKADRAAEALAHYTPLLSGSALRFTAERDYAGFLTDAVFEAAMAAKAAGDHEREASALAIFHGRRPSAPADVWLNKQPLQRVQP